MPRLANETQKRFATDVVGGALSWWCGRRARATALRRARCVRHGSRRRRFGSTGERGRRRWALHLARLPPARRTPPRVDVTHQGGPGGDGRAARPTSPAPSAATRSGGHAPMPPGCRRRASTAVTADAADAWRTPPRVDRLRFARRRGSAAAMGWRAAARRRRGRAAAFAAQRGRRRGVARRARRAYRRPAGAAAAAAAAVE